MCVSGTLIRMDEDDMFVCPMCCLFPCLRLSERRSVHAQGALAMIVSNGQVIHVQN